MNGVFERLIAPFSEYEGNVARMMGGTILPGQDLVEGWWQQILPEQDRTISTLRTAGRCLRPAHSNEANVACAPGTL